MIKYALYEKSVQSPDVHIDLFTKFYRKLRSSRPKRLREDFCGTFLFSCEWVKMKKDHFALGLDLDPEPLAYGKLAHWNHLTEEQKKRITIQQADVLNPTKFKSDMIVANNFSIFIFKTRAKLLEYFKSCLRSLNKDGILFLELAGGPGMIQKMKEKKTVKVAGKKIIYTWDQQSFDPITRDVKYAIHFKLPNGKSLKNAFTYDWRLWSIPEVRDLLVDSGFKKSVVYWETEYRGRGTGEYVPTEHGTNDFAWVTYIAALK